VSGEAEQPAETGLGVFAAAMPKPKAGCITKNGTMIVPMPMMRAGSKVGWRPAEASQRQKEKSENHPDGVMRDPAEGPLARDRCCGGDALVDEMSAREVA
jgi:hypothetical protein